MAITNIYYHASDFVKQLYEKRYLIYILAKRDFSKAYVRNVFGMVWAVLEPLAFITMLYFVFSMRFGDREALGVPYIVYLITGYIVYIFFVKTMNQTTTSIQESAYLLKRVNFRVAIIPLIKIL